MHTRPSARHSNSLTSSEIARGIRDIIKRGATYDFIGVTPSAEALELATCTGRWLADAGLTLNEALQHPRFTYANNLYRRLGDLELYTATLARELRDPDPWRAAVIGGSLIVGYFSTAKSILDAVAIAVNELFHLALAPRQQDLSKGEFMNTLGRADQAARTRYELFASFVGEVVAWRDASVHRVTPLLVVHSDHDPIETAPRKEVEIRMASRPDVTLATFPGTDAQHWTDPLAIPNLWRRRFLDLCREITVDVVR